MKRANRRGQEEEDRRKMTRRRGQDEENRKKRA